MIDRDQLLHLLNEPGIVSGAAIGDALGVTRMAVQKHIQALIDNGLPVEAIPSKGYRLADGVSLLNEASLLEGCKSEHLHSLKLFQSIDSTNSHLLDQPIELGRARVCVAESQNAGRGRRGNEWHSAPYRNVMMSLSWGFDHWPETITGLGLAVALTVAEYLRSEFSVDVKIKWPNDLLVNDKKLAGILIDVAGETSGACNVVVGVGLNVHQPDWSESSDYAWHDLVSDGVQCDRNTLTANLITALIDMLRRFEYDGFATLASRWNAMSSFAGKTIRVVDAEPPIVGEMIGVDAHGALLLLDSAGTEQRITDSSVSIRLVD